jgi:hypothetical protein
MLRLFLCEIDFNIGNLLDDMTGIDTEGCFADAFTADDKTPANNFFRDTLSKLSPSFRLEPTLKDFEKLPHLSAEGYRPIRWLETYKLHKLTINRFRPMAKAADLTKNLAVAPDDKSTQQILDNTEHTTPITPLARGKYRGLLKILLFTPTPIEIFINALYEKLFSSLLKDKRGLYGTPRALYEDYKNGDVKKIIVAQQARYQTFKQLALQWPEFMEYLKSDAATADFKQFCQNIHNFALSGVIHDVNVFISQVQATFNKLPGVTPQQILRATEGSGGAIASAAAAASLPPAVADIKTAAPTPAPQTPIMTRAEVAYLAPEPILVAAAPPPIVAAAATPRVRSLWDSLPTFFQSECCRACCESHCAVAPNNQIAPSHTL